MLTSRPYQYLYFTIVLLIASLSVSASAAHTAPLCHNTSSQAESQFIKTSQQRLYADLVQSQTNILQSDASFNYLPFGDLAGFESQPYSGFDILVENIKLNDIYNWNSRLFLLLFPFHSHW